MFQTKLQRIPKHTRTYHAHKMFSYKIVPFVR